MSNPHYEEDLKILDGVWDISKVVTPETVLIVTGCWVPAELLDRPVAGMLRDEIDRRGDPARGRRGIVMGDLWWYKALDLQTHPVISVGGPDVNNLTKDLALKGNVWESEGCRGCFLVTEGVPQVALWSADGTASKTRECVERFMRDPDGLTRFLEIWQQT